MVRPQLKGFVTKAKCKVTIHTTELGLHATYSLLVGVFGALPYNVAALALGCLQVYLLFRKAH